MSWYTKYLEYFEKPYDSVPKTTIEKVRKNFKHFETTEPPMASIAIAARNEELRLFSCLWSLSENVCKYPIEFIGVDNDSTDRTAEIYETVGVKYYIEKQKSPGYARQCGLNHSQGKHFICIDSDTLYPPHYIETMIEELEKPGIVGVSGMCNFIPGNHHSRLGLILYQLIRDLHKKILSFKRPELIVCAMFFAFRADYGKKIGFRVDLIRGGDDGAIVVGLKQYGKIKILFNRKVRVMTASNTLTNDGNLFNSFKVRLMKYMKWFRIYFTRKTYYKDVESNLIDSFKKKT